MTPTVERLAVLCVLLAAASPAGGEVEAQEEPAPPLRYVGLNRQGHEEWWRAKDGAVVIRVPGGPYLRRPYQGTVATEEPAPVEVRSFLMDKHEVTNERFARFLSENPDGTFVKEAVGGLERAGKGWRAAPGLEQHPATAATGHGALAYAAWVGGRIPSSDEWMKAAGGPEGRLYPWGDAPADGTRANYGAPVRRGLDPVGSRPAGASPFGCLDMAGNAYDRVMTRVRRGAEGADGLPVMLKGGSWVSSHPLNLRVLDLCMQGMDAAEGSVGFRCAMDDPEPDRPPRRADDAPILRIARDWDAAIAEAQARMVPVFLSLLHDTCGQCDRTIAQTYRDPRFVKYCNEHLVVVLGHQPWDADDDPHRARADGSCTVHPGVTCREHEELYRRGLAVVRGFQTSPGNFVLDPFRAEKGAAGKAFLVPEGGLPKGGHTVDGYLEAFEKARVSMGTPATRTAPETR